MDLTISVSEEELRFIRTFCIARPIASAISELDHSPDLDGDIPDLVQDLQLVQTHAETIRHKLVQSYFHQHRNHYPALLQEMEAEQST